MNRILNRPQLRIARSINLYNHTANTALIARQCITDLIPRSVVGLTLRLTLEINPRLNSISLKLLTNTPTAIRKIRKHLTRLILIAVMLILAIANKTDHEHKSGSNDTYRNFR